MKIFLDDLRSVDMSHNPNKGLGLVTDFVIVRNDKDFIKLVDYGTYYLNIRCSHVYDINDIKNMDIIKNNLKFEIIKIGLDIDYLLSQTNKCKEPLYIENLLCQLLI
jgi:hypothetical protein